MPKSSSKRLFQAQQTVSHSVVEEHHEVSTNGFSGSESDLSISERLKLLRKSPKTDYTYSPYSKDRYEIAPGIINMPNMSRLSYKNELNSHDYPDTVLHVRKNVSRSLNYSPTIKTVNIHEKTSYYESISSFIYNISSIVFISIISIMYKTFTFISYPFSRIFYNKESEYSSSTLSKLNNNIDKTPLYTFKQKQSNFKLIEHRSKNISVSQKFSQTIFFMSSLIYKWIGRVVVADIQTIVFIRKLLNASKDSFLKYLPFLMALLLLLLPVLSIYYFNPDLKEILPSKEMFSFWKSDESILKIHEISDKSEAFPCDSQMKSIIAHIEALQDSHESLQKDFKSFKSQINIFIDETILNLKSTSDLKIDFDLLRKELENSLNEKYNLIRNNELFINKYQVQSSILDDLQNQLNQLRIELNRKDSYVTIASDQDEKLIKNMVESLLKKYDADKTGMADFALETSGGSVISTPCTETYNAHSAVWMWKGLISWELPPLQPNVIIQPGLVPGKCWAFRGTNAKVVIQLSQTINVTAVSLEHIPKDISLTGHIDSAPKDFIVYAMKSENDLNTTELGSFIYEDNGVSIQTFYLEKPSVPLNFIQLELKSNHGNPTFTCIYRFRVHGNPVY